MEYFNYPVSSVLLSSAAEKKIPVNGTFELTQNCNFNCKMCYVHNCKIKKSVASADVWHRVFDEAQKNELLYVLVTGGEPLTHPEFGRIFNDVAGRGMLTILNTNGYLIDDETIRVLKKTPPVRINITLYGTSDSTYQALCGVADGFSVVSRNISRLTENGFNVNLNMTVVNDNINELRDMVAFADERKLEIRPTTYIFGSASGDNSCRPDAECAAKTAVELYFLRHSENEIKVRAKEMLFLLAKATETDKKTDARGITCRAGSCSYWVHADGRVSYCGMTGEEKAKNLFECGFGEAWTAAVKAADEVKKPKKCLSCRYRFVCNACHAMLVSDGATGEKINETYPCIYHRTYTDYFLERDSQL